MWMDTVLALRRLRHARTFVLAAILMLAAGVGVNTGLLAIARGFNATRAGISSPGTLVSLNRDRVGRQGAGFLSCPDYRDVRSSETFAEVVASRFFMGPVRLSGEARVLVMESVSENYFRALGVAPVVGRSIDAGSAGQSSGVCVISSRLWQRQFNGGAEVLGQSLRIGARISTVVGVAPSTFGGMYAPAVMPTDVWLPLGTTADVSGARLEDREAGCVSVWGRLASGTDLRQAQSALATLSIALERAHPSTKPLRPRAFDAAPFRDVWIHASIDPFVKRAAAGVGIISLLVLLLTCTQLGTMVLARNTDRQGELALRLALGATRVRVVRLLLSESVLLAIAGAAAASLVGWWAVVALGRIAPPNVRGIAVAARPAFDIVVLGMTFALAVLTIVVFGLIPALRSSRPDNLRLTSPDATPAQSGGGRLRGQQWLVAGQVAVSTFLLILAGSFARTYLRPSAEAFASDPSRLALVWLELGSQGYDVPAAERLFESAATQAAVLPDVRSSSYGDYLPGGNVAATGGRMLWVRAGERTESPVMSRAYRVSPGYLAAVGLRLIEGRDVTLADRAGSLPVVVIGESMARRFWPGSSAVGRVLMPEGRGSQPLTIVGVVSEVNLEGLSRNRETAVFVPFAQEPSTSAALVARTGQAADGTALALDRLVKAQDQNLATTQVSTLAKVLRERRYPVEIGARMMTGLGVLALGLGSGGIYALATYLVSRRRRELALRLALGATPAGLTTLVLKRSLWLTAIGCVAGLGLAMLSGKVAGALFFNPGSLDPIVCVAVPIGALALATLACAGPAWAASRVDPVKGLRE
jgi:predicted permease